MSERALAAFAVKPLGEAFACELEGVDLRAQATPDVAAAVMHATDRHGVAVLRGQLLDDPQQIAFARFFGTLAQAPEPEADDARHGRLAHREIFDAANLDAQGRILPDTHRRRVVRAEKLMWHTESFAGALAAWSLMSARLVPRAGAETEFADLHAAHDALPENWRERIAGVQVQDADGLTHPLVCTHPRTGRRALRLAARASLAVGLPAAQGRDLLQELTAFATQPRFVYRHRWHAGDLLVWDNRSTVYRAAPYDDFRERRDLRRTVVMVEHTAEHAAQPAAVEAAP
jgi:alpha-ketoglutarate-dependent 2,4-dichlorophenoxyacetate dioxygenase